jgi:excisionase family DNA binding protein
MSQAPEGALPAYATEYLAQHRYLSLSETVAYIGLSERTIRKLLPEIPHFRVGSKLLFRKTELDAWLLRYRERGDALDLNKIADEALKGLLRSS